MRHLSEEQLILYYYGEAEETADIEAHLASCLHCRSNYEGFQRVFAAVDSVEVPARADGYGLELWQHLHPRLLGRRRFGWTMLLHPPRWALAGTMAVIVVAAFLLGRFWRQPEVSPILQSAPEQVRERLLLASVGDHLERSQILLMELHNTAGNGDVDISTQQAEAEELLATNRLYRYSAASAGEVGMTSVLEDLERILLEIAHNPGHITTAELDQIRHRIDEQGILFKVRIIGSKVREREKAAAREMSRRIL